MRPYLGIEGPIGVGKTTLANYLKAHLQAEAMLEVFEENPFLEKFYQNRDCYALQTQLFFLMSRYRQHIALKQQVPTLLVSDYIFAKNDLFASFTLNGDEHALYQKISGALASQLVVPSLVVLLKADLDVLMSRIHKRGREYEQREDMQDYMSNLIQQYDTFFEAYTNAPVLVIDTNSVNIVEDTAARERVVQQVVGAFRDVLADHPTQAPLL